jgi:UDP-glucose 4-epimerase
MSPRSALVTGTTGFIATHLIPALLDDGWTVRACGRRPRPDWLDEAVDYHSADLVDDDLADLVDGITHVLHLAGASSSRADEEEMQRSNVGGTTGLIEAVVKAGAVERFLYMSTTAVYGEEEKLPSPVPEDATPHPSRGYGKAKWEAEQVVWKASEDGLPTIILRPVSVHGPGAIKLLASAILDVAVERFAGNTTLPIYREPVEQRLLHVTDLVNATIHVIDHDDAPGRAFNVGSGVYPTSLDVAEILVDHFDMTLEHHDDLDCGPTYEEREKTWRAMRERGMTDDIILTENRFRFMRKENLNNRISLDALLATGFELRHTDLREEAAKDIDWYREQRWII